MFFTSPETVSTVLDPGVSMFCVVGGELTGLQTASDGCDLLGSSVLVLIGHVDQSFHIIFTRTICHDLFGIDQKMIVTKWIH